MIKLAILLFNRAYVRVDSRSLSQEILIMSTLVITKDNFQSEVMDSEQPVLLDFWASWCGPCRMVSPLVDQIAEEMAGTAKVGKINVDEQPELASQFGVMSIPTLAVVKGGEVVKKAVGARPKDEIIAMIEEA